MVATYAVSGYFTAVIGDGNAIVAHATVAIDTGLPGELLLPAHCTVQSDSTHPGPYLTDGYVTQQFTAAVRMHGVSEWYHHDQSCWSCGQIGHGMVKCKCAGVYKDGRGARIKHAHVGGFCGCVTRPNIYMCTAMVWLYVHVVSSMASMRSWGCTCTLFRRWQV